MSVLDKTNKTKTVRVEDFLDTEHILIQPFGRSTIWTKWEEPKFYVADWKGKAEVHHYQVAEWMYRKFQEIGFTFLLDPNQIVNVMKDEFGLEGRKNKELILHIINYPTRRLEVVLDSGRSSGVTIHLPTKSADLSLFNIGTYRIDEAFNICKTK